MKFQVPQFIEIEDKLFGPLTWRQFVYVSGGVGASVLIFLAVNNFFIFILLAAPIAVLAFVLAFWEVNRRPFIYTLEAAFRYFISSKLYVWKRSENDLGVSTEIKSKSKEKSLEELAWSISVQDKTEVQSNKTDTEGS